MIDALDRPTQLRAARVVTELTSPTILAPVLLIAIAFQDTVKHGLSTLGWGIVAGKSPGWRRWPSSRLESAEDDGTTTTFTAGSCDGSRSSLQSRR